MTRTVPTRRRRKYWHGTDVGWIEASGLEILESDRSFDDRRRDDVGRSDRPRGTVVTRAAGSDRRLEREATLQGEYKDVRN